MKKATGDDIYKNEGYSAYFSTVHHTENPNIIGSDHWWDWYNGWLHARSTDSIADVCWDIDYGPKKDAIKSKAIHISNVLGMEYSYV